MAVSKKDVKYVAELARLSLNDKEEEMLVDDLNQVLGYMDKLNELNTENEDIIVNPYYIENKFREDEIKESMSLKDVLENAPQNIEEYVVVPKVIK